jgi:hypothetical protein
VGCGVRLEAAVAGGVKLGPLVCHAVHGARRGCGEGAVGAAARRAARPV